MIDSLYTTQFVYLIPTKNYDFFKTSLFDDFELPLELAVALNNSITNETTSEYLHPVVYSHPIRSAISKFGTDLRQSFFCGSEGFMTSLYQNGDWISYVYQMKEHSDGTTLYLLDVILPVMKSEMNDSFSTTAKRTGLVRSIFRVDEIINSALVASHVPSSLWFLVEFGSSLGALLDAHHDFMNSTNSFLGSSFWITNVEGDVHSYFNTRDSCTKLEITSVQNLKITITYLPKLELLENPFKIIKWVMFIVPGVFEYLFFTLIVYISGTLISKIKTTRKFDHLKRSTKYSGFLLENLLPLSMLSSSLKATSDFDRDFNNHKQSSSKCNRKYTCNNNNTPTTTSITSEKLFEKFDDSFLFLSHHHRYGLVYQHCENITIFCSGIDNFFEHFQQQINNDNDDDEEEEEEEEEKYFYSDEGNKKKKKDDNNCKNMETISRYIILSLDELFIRFDKICKVFELEKLRSFGDKYYAISGFHHNDVLHAHRAIKFAKKVKSTMEEYNNKFLSKLQVSFSNNNDQNNQEESNYSEEEEEIEIIEEEEEPKRKKLKNNPQQKQQNKNNKNKLLKFDLKIGLSSGNNVVGGIVGSHRFCFDLFGPTVSMSSFLESQCKPNEILVSESTYEILRMMYSFQKKKLSVQNNIKCFKLLQEDDDEENNDMNEKDDDDSESEKTSSESSYHSSDTSYRSSDSSSSCDNVTSHHDSPPPTVNRESSFSSKVQEMKDSDQEDDDSDVEIRVLEVV